MASIIAGTLPTVPRSTRGATWKSDRQGYLRRRIGEQMLILAETTQSGTRQGNPMSVAATSATWLDSYWAIHHILNTTDIPILIVTDDVWQCLLADGLPAAARPFFHRPRTGGERLFYATAFFDLLVDYRAGKRTGFLPTLLKTGVLLNVLQDEFTAIAPGSHPDLLAPFAAIYDLFHGD